MRTLRHTTDRISSCYFVHQNVSSLSNQNYVSFFQFERLYEMLKRRKARTVKIDHQQMFPCIKKRVKLTFRY